MSDIDFSNEFDDAKAGDIEFLSDLYATLAKSLAMPLSEYGKN